MPGLRRQLADHGSGEGTATHVAQGRIIDHVVGVSGAQQIEEVQPALAGPRAEPGEAVVTDLCAEAILSGVARASIVHRDPCRRLQASPQHLTVLDEEVTLAVNQHRLPAQSITRVRPRAIYITITMPRVRLERGQSACGRALAVCRTAGHRHLCWRSAR